MLIVDDEIDNRKLMVQLNEFWFVSSIGSKLLHLSFASHHGGRQQLQLNVMPLLLFCHLVMSSLMFVVLQILSVVPTTNAHLRVFYIKTVKLNYGKVKDVTCGLTYHWEI
jgi:hypothetical protein